MSNLRKFVLLGGSEVLINLDAIETICTCEGESHSASEGEYVVVTTRKHKYTVAGTIEGFHEALCGEPRGRQATPEQHKSMMRKCSCGRLCMRPDPSKPPVCEVCESSA